MDEDQILSKSIDSEPLANDPITPSGVIKAASESQKVDHQDSMPSNIVVSADSAETNEDDQVKIESGDHSIKSGIDQIKTTLEKDDEPAPVINVNVETPVKVIKGEPSGQENITNLNVTNVYQIEGSDETKTGSEKVSELTPNLITSDQSNKEEISQSTPIKVETEPIVTKGVIEKLLSETDRLTQKGPSIENAPAKSVTEITPSTVAEKASSEGILPAEKAEARVETVKMPVETLRDLLIPDETIVDYGKMSSLENIDSQKLTYQDSATPAAVMADLLKSYQEESKETTRLFQEDFSKTLDSLEKSQEKIDYLSTVIPPDSNASVNPLEINKSTQVDKLYDLLVKEAKEKPRLEEEPAVRTDLQKMSLSETLPINSEERDADLSISKMKTIPISDIRVETAERKINPALIKEILASPEMKQLKNLSTVMDQVRSQIESLNETQVTNNQTINTIANSVNSVNSVESQKMIPGESEKASSVQKEEGKKAEPTSGSLSDYYLHAIYDALVSYGIKLRTY